MRDTLQMDGDAVAKEIVKIHREYVSVIQYNNENSLSSVLSIAYLSAMQYYFKPIREFPAGRGFADFVFILCSFSTIIVLIVCRVGFYLYLCTVQLDKINNYDSRVQH